MPVALKAAFLKTKTGQRIRNKRLQYLDRKQYRSMRKMILNESPERAIRSHWDSHMKYPLNLNKPQSFNEKLQWLKLNWYDERSPVCANKHLVREYVSSKGLDHILIKQLGFYKSPREIDFKVLPDRFVLKPSHDSGHTIICQDKSSLDIRKTRNNLRKWLSVDYEYMSGEWVYRSEKYIVCEEYLEDKDVGEIVDYKIFCFNGEPTIICLISDRAREEKNDFYDLEWNLLPFCSEKEQSGKIFPKPSRLDDMIRYAKLLSAGFPFVRADFYQVGEKVYFGELTFFNEGGFCNFQPESIDFKLGSLLTLPREKSHPWGMLLSKNY
ncbi:MAG: glycosyl transferase [Firmicutes bacterium]|nr:glycosyl transferase [Bacillota bacterium]